MKNKILKKLMIDGIILSGFLLLLTTCIIYVSWRVITVLDEWFLIDSIWLLGLCAITFTIMTVVSVFKYLWKNRYYLYSKSDMFVGEKELIRNIERKGIR